jgi:ABC-type phosphate/phosphonate transport system substrate-binding protein
MTNKFSIYWVLFLLNLFFLQNSILYSQSFKDHPLRIVLSSSMFQNAKTEDIEAATKILAGELNKEKKNAFDFEIVVCNNQTELISNLKSQFDLLYISPIEYLQLKKNFDIEPALVTETNNNYGDIYYLVTSKKDNKNEIGDLKNGVVFILSKTDEQAASLWLDKILFDNKLPVKSKFFKKINFENKSTNVVLPVFFKKATASVISSSSFELLSELNPQIKKDAQILKTSKPFIRAIFCFDRRNKDEKRKKYLLEYMSNIHQGAYGKQITELYMVDKLIPFKQEYMNNILELYK